jgi:dTDP-glucose 4,6-dehydratase
VTPATHQPSPRPLQRVLVTGGSGFIGSAVLRRLLARPGTRVLNYDALTYAGLRESVAELETDPRYEFVHGDVLDTALLRDAIRRFRPDVLVHLAAESHVDRSIAEPTAFVRTNVEGTASVLGAWLEYRDELAKTDAPASDRLLLVHTSTDEVYGPLDAGEFADAAAPYNPSSPYSASKAAADHLVRAFGRTYSLASVIACPTNNYGPRQFPEKLIPLATLRALRGEPIPLYGDGLQVRDWLHVEDCAAGFEAIAERGVVGATYHLGAAAGYGEASEWPNRRIVEAIADAVGERKGDTGDPRQLIVNVSDRPGHDRRYALDSSRARNELGWAPTIDLTDGIRQTVRWYAENTEWVATAEGRR